MALFAELNDLFVRYRIRPRKAFGQHFMINEEVIKKMVELADLNPSDKVIEIGAGTGFLTRELASKCEVFAYELDYDLCDLLKEELKGLKVSIICGDFLKAELPPFNKVASIPPYGISKKIMLKLLRHNFDSAIMIFQEEFVEKLTAFPGFPSYAAISVFAQYKADIEVVEKVSASSFFPKPKSDSAIVKIILKKNKENLKNDLLFYRFVAELFRYRKKNLGNALTCAESFLNSNFGLTYEVVYKSLKDFNLDLKVELNETAEFLRLFGTISDLAKKRQKQAPLQ
ncbi:MAG: 16S rRNA (adenine(1518)-N(6)/adenine(1519)-N(6))-dimethyltransferase RsmA [Candidatus Diapherotrites archaeon]|nr:16S rRNA (adenine(1518)-N(6)/adenine(1519)-N(6))-dimethyltransferase RsmA [Candidatus Diapherotrites archaeon]